MNKRKVLTNLNILNDWMVRRKLTLISPSQPYLYQRSSFPLHSASTYLFQEQKGRIRPFQGSTYTVMVAVSKSTFRAMQSLKVIWFKSAKILLLPPKYEIIMLPSKHLFSNIAIAILDCSLLLFVKLSLLILYASFLVSVLCFFFDGSLSKVIALPNIAIALSRS
jgi:hypothetical protein